MTLKTDNPRIAIVGINSETANLLPLLLAKDNLTILRILNNEQEDVRELGKYPDLDVIINTTSDPAVSAALRSLNLPAVDVMSGLSARILFLSGKSSLFDSVSGEERGRVLTSLHEIRQAVLLSKNKEELLKLILTLAMRLNKGDSGSIMLLDTADRTLKIEIAEGLAPEIITATAQKIGKGIAGKVVRTREPLLINGGVGLEEGGLEYERKELSSAICCPLLIAGEAVGAICINSTTPGHCFTAENLQYVRKLAEFTADVIRTSKDYEQASQTSFSLSLIDNARKILSLAYPFEERLNLLLMRIANTFNAEICNYYHYHPDLKSFFVKASSSFRITMLHGKVLKLNEYLAKKTLGSKDTVVVEIHDKKGSERKWYIVQPLMVGEHLQGVLFLHLINNRNDCRGEKEIIRQIGELLALELGKDVEKENFRIKTMKFTAISEAAFDLAAGSSRFELARFVVANACLILEAESCVLRLVNKRTEELEVIDSFSLRSGAHLRELQILDEVIAREAFEARDILLKNDLQNNPLYADKNFSARSVLSICLQRNGRKLGTLSMYNKRSLDFFGLRRFSDGDKEIFLSYSLQISKAFARFLI